ncbi:sigma-70 family RNA polymerase sigma factor [Sulfitobacter sp.]|nr:sigma-70 family RNA polymerase sigma factor [Sulfitobacter sp.]
MSDKTDKTSLWVDEMLRVRDSRDRAAFASLFAHFAPRIKGFLMKSGTDATTAEECAQDVMTTLWRKADQFDPTRASASTWIFAIARNRRIDMLRRDRRPEPEELTWGPEPEPEQSAVLEMQQESARLVEAIAALPENQRKLIEQAYFGELTQAEISQITGLPLGTIKSRFRLALDRLRHAMK